MLPICLSSCYNCRPLICSVVPRLKSAMQAFVARRRKEGRCKRELLAAYYKNHNPRRGHVDLPTAEATNAPLIMDPWLCSHDSFAFIEAFVAVAFKGVALVARIAAARSNLGRTMPVR